MDEMGDTVLADARWLSVHLGFNAHSIYDSHADRVILWTVAPLVADLRSTSQIDAFFFVRYADRGPHIRLRLTGDSYVLQETVRPAVNQFIRDSHPAVRINTSAQDGTPPLARDDAKAGQLSELTWMPYELELARYGGAESMRVAQQVFEASSTLAIELIGVTGENRTSRLGQAILAMVVLLHVFLQDGKEVLAFLLNYCRSYLPPLARQYGVQEQDWIRTFNAGYERQAETMASFVNDAWQRLDEGSSLTQPLDEYRKSLLHARLSLRHLQSAGLVVTGTRAIGSWPFFLQRVVPSYMHMMNNRLGISISEEAYLAHLLSRSLPKHVATE
jgi:thiopeptide-type bacteriocin biosynthesis protein